MGEIKYAAIVPLIGGMILGAQKATHGQKPEFILSYPPFLGNDKILTDYMPEVPYHTIDPETNLLPTDTSLPEVDFISALCPCAGLSQLNSAASRGANAPQNEWMYKTAEFVLEQIKPKVFWGENAPALYGVTGLPVAERLREISERNGYSMSLLRTSSTLHGVPQKRQRTFYFFWKGTNAPILNWYSRALPTLKEYFMQMPVAWLDTDEVETKTLALVKDPLYQWLRHEHGDDWRSHVLKMGKSLMDVVLLSGKIDDYLEFVKNSDDYSEEAYNRAKHAKHKREIGKNYWDFSPFIPAEYTGALTGARMNMIHPFEDRFMTYRELAHLMGLPIDMKIPTEAPGKIFQNVPSMTSADWTTEVIKYINGELEDSGVKFLHQDNIQQKIELEQLKSKEITALF